MAEKKYVDLSGLQEFLTQLKGAYSGVFAGEGTDGFKVDVSHIALATGESKGLLSSSDFTKLAGISTGANKVEASETNGNIQIDGTETTVYSLPIASDSTLGGVKSGDVISVNNSTGVISVADVVASTSGAGGAHGLMTAAQAEKLAGVATGAQVNVLEGVQFKGSGESSYADLTIDGNKKVQIDLSGYALKTDIAAALNFKGAKTGDQLAALTAADVANGDVYSCTADDSGASVTFHAGYEYAATLSGDPAVLTWVELGKYLDLSGYVLKTQEVNGKALSGDITLDGSDIALTGYTTTGISGDVAAADSINTAIAKVEVKANANASGKADKVASATNGNFAGLDANGNLTDSGSKAADFVPYAIGARPVEEETPSADAGKILVVGNDGNLALQNAPDTGVTSLTATSPLAVDQASGAVTVSISDAYGDTKNPYGAKTANTVLAGPTSGSAAAPSFRALVEADIPGDMAVSKIKFGSGAFTSGHVVGVDASGYIVDSGIAYADIDNDLNSITMNGETVTITNKNAVLSITSADSDAIAVSTSSAGAVTLSMATASTSDIDGLFSAS